LGKVSLFDGQGLPTAAPRWMRSPFWLGKVSLFVGQGLPTAAPPMDEVSFLVGQGLPF